MANLGCWIMRIIAVLLLVVAFVLGCWLIGWSNICSTLLLLLLLYFLTGFVYDKTSKNPVASVLSLSDMPLLRPVPIPTKNCSWGRRILVWLYEPRQWELAKEWTYELDPGTHIIIPQGFRFDGASVPRPLWVLLNPSGLLLIPGLIHDYGYRYALLWQINMRTRAVTVYAQNEPRIFWDQLLYKVGQQTNGILPVNCLVFLAAYLGGCGIWKRHREKKAVASHPCPPFL